MLWVPKMTFEFAFSTSETVRRMIKSKAPHGSSNFSKQRNLVLNLFSYSLIISNLFLFLNYVFSAYCWTSILLNLFISLLYLLLDLNLDHVGIIGERQSLAFSALFNVPSWSQTAKAKILNWMQRTSWALCISAGWSTTLPLRDPHRPWCVSMPGPLNEM